MTSLQSPAGVAFHSSTTAKFLLPFYHFMLKNETRYESGQHFAAFSFVTVAEVVDVCTRSVLQFIEFVHFHAKTSWRSTCEGDSVENSSPNLVNTARPSRTLLHAGLSRSRGSRPSTTRTSSSSRWLYCHIIVFLPFFSFLLPTSCQGRAAWRTCTTFTACYVSLVTRNTI